ncbi:MULTISPECIES: hypothetical protein [Ruegeria]|uniref:hypothetical protein n=1 Tax=Ruegeria sp. HKCCA5491 TaxID=2682986 RepID=UPI0014800426
MAVFPVVYARLSLVPDLFLPDLFALDHGLEGYSSATHFALMSVLLVVVVQPFFQIGLQRNLRRERTQNNYAMSELDSKRTCGDAADRILTQIQKQTLQKSS